MKFEISGGVRRDAPVPADYAAEALQPMGVEMTNGIFSGVLAGMSATVAANHTPAALHRELRLLAQDGLFIVIGVLGVAFGVNWLVAAGAVGHLYIGFRLSMSALMWLVITPVLLAITTGLLIGAAHLLAAAGIESAQVSEAADLTGHQIVWTAATAVVLSGVVSGIFGALGSVGELVDYKIREMEQELSP